MHTVFKKSYSEALQHQLGFVNLSLGKWGMSPYTPQCLPLNAQPACSYVAATITLFIPCSRYQTSALFSSGHSSKVDFSHTQLALASQRTPLQGFLPPNHLTLTGVLDYTTAFHRWHWPHCWEYTEFTNTTITCRLAFGIQFTYYLTRGAFSPLDLWLSFTGTSHYSPSRNSAMTNRLCSAFSCALHPQTDLNLAFCSRWERAPDSRVRPEQQHGSGCGPERPPAAGHAAGPNPLAQPAAAHGKEAFCSSACCAQGTRGFVPDTGRGKFTYLNTSRAVPAGSVTLPRLLSPHGAARPGIPPSRRAPGPAPRPPRTFLRAARRSRCCGVSPTRPPSRCPELLPRPGAAPPRSAEAKSAQGLPPRSAMTSTACPAPLRPARARAAARPGEL